MALATRVSSFLILCPSSSTSSRHVMVWLSAAPKCALVTISYVVTATSKLVGSARTCARQIRWVLGFCQCSGRGQSFRTEASWLCIICLGVVSSPGSFV